MNPITPLLLLLGYAVALPVGLKLSQVVATQNRLAMFGHQAGVVVAGFGWVLSGRWTMVGFHTLWLLGARFWFWYSGRSD